MPGQSPPDVNIPIFICFVVYDGMFMSQSYDFSVPLFLCFRHFVRSFCHIPCMAVAGHTAQSPKTYGPTGKNIVCYCQYHCMPRAIASYAIGKIIACQSRTAGNTVKKQGWMPQPPPLHSIFRPACRRRGRGSFHLSQRHFLHRVAHLYDIDTVRQAADDSICAAIDAHSPGGIYLDHRRRCRAVCALDAYRAVNHLNYHF